MVGDFGEKRIRDAVARRNDDAFGIVFAVLLKSVFKLLAIRLEEADSLGEIRRRFIRAEQQAAGIVSR